MRAAAAVILCLIGSAHAQGLGYAQQSQGQSQGQTQGQMATGVGIAGAASGSASRAGASSSVSSAPSQSVTVTSPAVPAAPNDYTVRTVPNVLTGAVYPTAPCMGSSQVGGAGVGFGFSVGTSWTDEECGIRETARSFAGMGLKDDALAVLCTSKYAAAAPSCKQ